MSVQLPPAICLLSADSRLYAGAAGAAGAAEAAETPTSKGALPAPAMANMSISSSSGGTRHRNKHLALDQRVKAFPKGNRLSWVIKQYAGFDVAIVRRLREIR